ncbi:hypothetical protein AMATHDRAFT_1286 [Amanita thiersii Skay4041]|uniref:Protein kinase domain-containing protein n=1 Tax=Amanita thiersii Skay4041 TaxID=703135 RepID=A0A2A9NZT2_9AGAR|nr:hypothetical protein AMATHDRAFT_1286 [Amanita thiersii Skay4041]
MSSMAIDVQVCTHDLHVAPVAHAIGEFSNLYQANLRISKENYLHVVVKELRGYRSTLDEVAVKEYTKIVNTVATQWCSFSHPNVMECYGLLSLNWRMGLILPSCGSNVLQYVQGNPTSDRLRLSQQIASAVAHLHSRKVIHTDIRPVNILMHNGTPLLMDAGLGAFHDRTDFTRAHASRRYRWSAPELYDPREVGVEHEASPEPAVDVQATDEENPPYTLGSDVYALGMTIFTILSGTLPFPHIRHDYHALTYVLNGERPQRPVSPSVSDVIWEIVEISWHRRPDMRPTAEMVEKIFGQENTRQSIIGISA